MNLGRASLILVFVGALLLFSGLLPYQAVLITGDSMEPTLTEGDVALVQKTDDVTEGDIAVFYSSEAGESIAHRVLQDTEQGLITQGDNNAVTDQEQGIPPVQENQITGRIMTFGEGPAHLPIGTTLGQLLERPQTVGAFVMMFALGYYLLVTGGQRGREHVEYASEIINPMMLLVFVATILVITIGATGTPISVFFTEDPPQNQPAIERVGVDDPSIRVEVNSNSPPFSYRFVDVRGDMQIEDVQEGSEGNQLFVTLNVEGRDTIGSQSGVVEVRHYPRVLPYQVIQPLHAIHPFLATVVTAGALLVPGIVYYLVLIDPKELIREVRRNKR